MYCAPLQDWTTIRGAATTVLSVTQMETNWLDMTPFQDVVAWLEVKEVSATGVSVQMAYQTAPSKDEALFVSLTTPFALTTGVTVTPMLKDIVTMPISRWMRWQILVPSASSSIWDATFRIWIAANSPGLRLA